MKSRDCTSSMGQIIAMEYRAEQRGRLKEKHATYMPRKRQALDVKQSQHQGQRLPRSQRGHPLHKVPNALNPKGGNGNESHFGGSMCLLYSCPSQTGMKPFRVLVEPVLLFKNEPRRTQEFRIARRHSAAILRELTVFYSKQGTFAWPIGSPKGVSIQ